ncbi:hypothetical protein Hsw_0243 [Hymenobacter swuensis DY53]|uniref:Uncharacterized protein n=1 Tax=Hymenobacter swuensis DY53 TaxID=1227739 RepID=W8ETG5_9BACT|nr:hypothetical protein Hsw_0243 [Hymenobacter swuensis DY53]
MQLIPYSGYNLILTSSVIRRALAEIVNAITTAYFQRV